MAKLSGANVLVVIFLSMCECCFAQIVPRDEPLSKISIGMPITTVVQVLANAELPAAGQKPFAAHPAGDKWLVYALDKDSADLVIRYSPATQHVTGISVHYWTKPRSRTEISVTVSSIQFFDDGSYSIRHPSSRTLQTSKQGVGKSKASATPTKKANPANQRVHVDDIGRTVSLAGRLGEPLGTMLTVTGTWSYPNLRVKDYSLRFTVITVNGKQLARPVMFPLHSVIASKDGANAIPPHANHRELAGATWTMRAYETGRFTKVPAEYWHERGTPAMVSQPTFVSELVGFVRFVH